MKEKWVDNHGVSLQYLYNGNFDSDLTPLFITPGVSETAEDYIWIMEKLTPRPCAVLTFRGRGKSDVPKDGYTLYDHIQDMETVLEDLNMKEFIIYGYSRGVSYMLGYTLSNLDKVQGMIIGDYPAVHTKIPEKWLQNFAFSQFPDKNSEREQPRMRYRAARSLQQDSHEVIFWEALQSFKFPVLIMRGSGKDSRLSKQDMRKYEWYLPDYKCCVMQKGGHNLYQDACSFSRLLGSYCTELDGKHR